MDTPIVIPRQLPAQWHEPLEREPGCFVLRAAIVDNLIELGWEFETEVMRWTLVKRRVPGRNPRGSVWAIASRERSGNLPDYILERLPADNETVRLYGTKQPLVIPVAFTFWRLMCAVSRAESELKRSIREEIWSWQPPQ